MAENSVLSTEKLCVGYRDIPLIDNINFQLKRGQILSLIGANGTGKSTILKTITGQLPVISGKVLIEGCEINKWPHKELAKKLAVVLTERVQPEMITCFEVASMGRYPYTGRFGVLTDTDRTVIWETLRRVHAEDIADRDFTQLSDGQKQRILIARALCQQPDVLVLDEPTSYLDIHNKIELLDILIETAREKQTAIILSLHEIDLAEKVSDLVMCVSNNHVDTPNKPDEVFSDKRIRELYGLKRGSYLVNRGSAELAKPCGKARVFVVGGAGSGLKHYRELQKRRIPFAAGVLFENDLEFEVAQALAEKVISAKPFDVIPENIKERAMETMLTCEAVLDAGAPEGQFNLVNRQLVETARNHNMNIVFSAGELQ